MRTDSVKRLPDYRSEASKNVAWYLLPKAQSTDDNLHIMLERYEPGGDFAEHSHDFQQTFYICQGTFEMTIGGETNVYGQGDIIVMEVGEAHSGRNVADGISELLAVDYWPIGGAS
jgi:quercetin dioxygenase-like cupin family protein